MKCCTEWTQPRASSELWSETGKQRSSAEHRRTVAHECLEDLFPELDSSRTSLVNCHRSNLSSRTPALPQTFLSYYRRRRMHPCPRADCMAAIRSSVASSILLCVVRTGGEGGRPEKAGTDFTCSISNAVAWNCVRGSSVSNSLTGWKDGLPHHSVRAVRGSWAICA